jgi:hypothetical protein
LTGFSLREKENDRFARYDSELGARLKQADLVKFAKSKPLDFEITEDRNKIQKAILTLDSSIPVEIEIEEDALLNEVQNRNRSKFN